MFSFTKKCPKCEIAQFYTKKCHRDNALKRNVWCNKCRGNERKIKVPDNGWLKSCPICNKDIIYSTKGCLDKSIKNNGYCRKCVRNKNRPVPVGGYKRICSRCRKELIYVSTRNFNRAVKRNGWCRECNGKYTDKKGNIGYNPKACEFIDKLNKENGWNLQHSLNGGEVIVSGYFLDGYDSDKNIVFEYDEYYHNLKRQKQKDLIRQQRIIDKILPKSFFRYDERNNRLYDVMIQI
jgi:hypothetical protein